MTQTQRTSPSHSPPPRAPNRANLSIGQRPNARDLQVQERLTVQIADWLQEHLAPKGVGVVLEAEHLCMSLRGVQKFGAKTITSALHGLVRNDPRTRHEFLALTTRSQP